MPQYSENISINCRFIAVFYCHTLTVKNASLTYECPWWHRNTAFTKIKPLSTHLVNIICDEMGSMHKALTWLFEFELINQMLFFSWNTILLGRMSDKLWLFRLKYLTDIFQNWMKWTCYTGWREEEITVFVCQW